MPQLDPVVLFLQSFLLITFYLFFYFFFFRIYIFPFFFFNFKFTYYYSLKIYNNILLTFFNYTLFYFFFRYIYVNWFKNLTVYYTQQFQFLFEIEICKNFKLIISNFLKNLWSFEKIKTNFNDKTFIIIKNSNLQNELSNSIIPIIKNNNEFIHILLKSNKTNFNSFKFKFFIFQDNYKFFWKNNWANEFFYKQKNYKNKIIILSNF